MAAAVPPVKDGRRRYERRMATPTKPLKQSTREERLAAALRANLRKRKAREADAPSEKPETGEDR